MTLRAVFAYNNLDDTADLNAHFKALVKKGVISGGLILPVASSSNITINPFYAASSDGMIINEDTVTTLECIPGQINLIVLRAIYNAPAAPTLLFECVSQISYNADPIKSALIIFGSVDLTASSYVTLSTISYEKRDRVDQVGHSRLIGTYSSIADRDTAWPAIVPASQQTNDLTIVINAISGQPAFYFWNGTIWSPFGNYEQLAADFATHTSGVVGAGATVHVTADQKAALAGTSGLPNAMNPYVTVNDTDRVLTIGQKAAINNAKAGGDINAANPLIGDQLPVAITKLVAYTPVAAYDYVNVARGTGLISFGAPVYVGNLGVDLSSNLSSARNRFKIEDAFSNGYSDSEGPLFVIDILDAAGSGSYSPVSDTTNVSSIGYWDPANQSAALRIKFNRVLGAGKTVYIKFNARGTVSGLAPGGAYLPATTAFNSGRDSYQESFVQVVGTSTIGLANITQLYLANGSTTAPSLAFSADHGTGLFYNGSLINEQYSTYTSLGIALNTETMVLFTRASASKNIDLKPLDSPLMIEQVVNDDTDAVSYRFYQCRTLNGTNMKDSGINFGWADYTTGYNNVLTLGHDVHNVSRAIFDGAVTFNHAATFSIGTEIAPSIAFAGQKTGLYYVGTNVVTNIDTNTSYSIYNTIGLTFHGKTAFAFATSTPTNSLTDSLDGSMVFEQAVVGDTITYRRIINVDAYKAENSVIAKHVHSFGYSTYATDYVELMSIDRNGVSISAYANAYAFTTNGVTFLGFGNQGTSWQIGHELYYDSDGSLVTIGKPLTVAGALTASTIHVINGTELAPSIGFTSKPKTGFYYVDSVSTLYTATPTKLTIRSAIGVSIDGIATVLFGRNAPAPTGLGTNEVPLLIEQFIDPDYPSLSSMQIVGFNRTSADPLTTDISIGFGDYANSFAATAIFKSNRFTVTQPAYFESTGRFTGTVIAESFSGSSYDATTDSIAREPAYTVGNGSGMFGSNNTVGLSVNGISVLNYTSAGSLTVSATTTFSGTTVTISANTTLNILGTLSLPNAISCVNLTSTGTITAKVLHVSDNSTFAAALTVGDDGTGQPSTGASLTVKGSNTPFTAEGISTFKGATYVLATGSFTCSGQSTFTKTISLTDTAGIEVGGGISVSGSILVGVGIVVSGGIEVGGGISVSGGIAVGGGISLTGNGGIETANGIISAAGGFSTTQDVVANTSSIHLNAPSNISLIDVDTRLRQRSGLIPVYIYTTLSTTGGNRTNEVTCLGAAAGIEEAAAIYLKTLNTSTFDHTAQAMNVWAPNDTDDTAEHTVEVVGELYPPTIGNSHTIGFVPIIDISHIIGQIDWVIKQTDIPAAGKSSAPDGVNLYIGLRLPDALPIGEFTLRVNIVPSYFDKTGAMHFTFFIMTYSNTYNENDSYNIMKFTNTINIPTNGHADTVFGLLRVVKKANGTLLVGFSALQFIPVYDYNYASAF